MNLLRTNLTDRVVLVKKEILKPDYKNIDRRFLCQGGFGCHPNTMGKQIYGIWLCDNTDGNITGYDVESLVEEKAPSPENA